MVKMITPVFTVILIIAVLTGMCYAFYPGHEFDMIEWLETFPDAPNPYDYINPETGQLNTNLFDLLAPMIGFAGKIIVHAFKLVAPV